MEARNARWNGLGGIDCEINHPHYGWIPFTASPDDVEKHGREIFKALKESGDVAPYEPPLPPTDDELAKAVREERDRLLMASDWTQLTDVPENTRASWAAFRQALRDIPTQPGFPGDVKWPEAPAR